MHGVIAAGVGGTDVLSIVSLPRPEPRRGEVLIEVAAAGVNRADIMQREGRYDPPPGTDTNVLGLECAGRIVAVGPGVPDEHLGRSVCALLAGGGYADYVRVPFGQVASIPRGLTPEEAAALPEAAATVWSNLILRGGLRQGERVLVHGGASGIGAMAIQIATAVGAEVVATVGTVEKASFCRRLGAQQVFVRGEDDFVEKLSHPSARVDVVLDIVGGPYLRGNLAVLRREGRLVQVGLLGGPIGNLDLSQLLERNLTLTGSGLRSRPLEEKARIMHDLEQRMWPLVERGSVTPTVHAVLPLEEARTAHELLERGHVQGKLVLRPLKAHASTSTHQEGRK
jgi:putative PIG3 family NAD(P)H quinone oxidoreductase